MRLKWLVNQALSTGGVMKRSRGKEAKEEKGGAQIVTERGL